MRAAAGNYCDVNSRSCETFGHRTLDRVGWKVLRSRLTSSSHARMLEPMPGIVQDGAILCLLAALGAGCVSTPPPTQAPPVPQAPPPTTPDAEQPEPEISFVDPKDGQFDLSQFLASRIGFVPIPIVITEPAVGFGGGLGLMFLHDHLGRRDAAGRSLGVPSITGVAGGYAESATWFAGALHCGSWNHDSLRDTGGVGGARANLDFFGTGGGPAGGGGEASLPFQLDGFGTRQELLARVP